MERVTLRAFGFDTPLDYSHDDVEPPAPTGSDVLVEVDACGVAHRDLIDRSGRMKFIALPIVLGHEFSGTVVATGPESEWEVGDHVGALHRDSCGACPRCAEGETSHCAFAMRVFGITIDGGYASHVLSPSSALYRLPDSLRGAAGAILNSTFGTAYRAMNRFGGLTPGQTVLTTGANGGVGHAGIQIAKRQGATVIAQVRSDQHVAFVEGLGADQVIVDDGSGFHRKLPGDAVDVVLDCVGSPTFNSSLRSVRLGGGVGLVGNVSDSRVEVNMGRIVVGDVRICGSTGATRSDLAAVIALVEGSDIQFEIAREFPLHDAESAHAALRAGGVHGRLVLLPGR
jgi:acryloyl-coenzyme A reductase